MFTKKFLIDTLERAAKTFAQVVVTLTTVVAAGNGTINDVDWLQVLSAAALASIISIMMSFASSGINDSESASLVK